MRYFLWILMLIASYAVADQAMLDRTDVQAYIHKTSKELGIPKADLDAVFLSVVPRPAVIHQMKHPAEAMTWERYKRIIVTQKRIDNGVKFWHQHANILAEIEKKYHVSPSIIVATIGMESNYGANKGNFRVIDALADLAFNYPDRSRFFQYELTEFFILTMVEHPVDPLSIKGSYAGAIGWPQFMPHSIRSFGVDHSGDGIIDLSNNVDDIMASIANYYTQNGWNAGHPIAIAATCESDQDPFAKNSPKTQYPYSTLKKAGYTAKQPWPSTEKKASVLHFSDEYWFCFPNFNVIMRYNKSPLYAMAIKELSDKITANYNQAYP